MQRSIYLLMLSFFLFGCGGNDEDSSLMLDADAAIEDTSEAQEDTIPMGSFETDLPANGGSGRATCNINLTRIVEKRLANIILTLDVIGEGCDGMGRCENENMQDGELNFSGGIDGDKAFATMIANYEPPSESEDEELWMYNVIHKKSPFSSFEMLVDGEPFNVLTSDTKGAENFAKGPHVWDVQVDIEADMLQSNLAADQSVTGTQTLGKYSYNGPCEVFAKYMNP